MPGKQGGTWMSMNKKNGKIGVLLNILQPHCEIEPTKLGRGFIVNDFLTCDESHSEYLQSLSKAGNNYNGFQTIVLEIKEDHVEGSYFSNFLNKPPSTLEEGIHSFGNSLNPYDPWPKVTYGRKRFESIMAKHKTIETKEKLVEDLFEMLMDKTLLPVDQQMLHQGNDRQLDSLRKLSALCVSMPESAYGSRTWTVILVDSESNVEYIEKTIKEPSSCINTSIIDYDCTTSHYRFKIG